jgi:hypothetical protein
MRKLKSFGDRICRFGANFAVVRGNRYCFARTGSRAIVTNWPISLSGITEQLKQKGTEGKIVFSVSASP